MNIIEALEDRALFRPLFGPDLSTWSAWIVALKAIFALPMADPELEVFRRHTGRERPPSRQVSEAWIVVGRRGGKSRFAALLAVFAACFRAYSPAPGERLTIPVVAADRKQARTVLGYVNGLLDVPMLSRLVEKRTLESVDLASGVSVEVHTSSYRSIRGYSVPLAVCDELAFWRSEDAADPDVEIVNALRPCMATVPGSLLVSLSSPHRRAGLLWRMHERVYGRESDDVLCWKAGSTAMNSTLDQAVIARAFELDAVAAAAEYGAEFRSDLETFVPREAVEECIVRGRYEVPPTDGTRYSAFVDPSGGSRDSFTLAIAHSENGKAVLDCLRERKPPFSPEAVVEEFSETLKTYRIREVTGDRYAGEWPREQFRKAGIEYVPSAKTKSDLYLAFLPMLNSGRVELLDNKTLTAQLCALERRTSRGGKDSVDHPPGAHDDLANAAAGALVLVSAARCTPGIYFVNVARRPSQDDWVNAKDVF